MKKFDGSALWAKLRNFRLPALILLLGAALLLIPTGSKKTAAATQPAAAETAPSLEDRLGTLLSQVKGAGRVSVLLTERTGSETVYQTDSTTDGGEQKTVTVTTVLAGGGTAGQTPVVKKTVGPVYLGAAVVADGGDVPSVRLELVNAIAGLTGLGADKITVMGRKS